MRAHEMRSAAIYRAQIQAMMADPDLTGDVLLLAVAMLNQSQLAIEAGQQRFRWSDVCRDLGWDGSHKLRWTIADDFPRYEVERSKLVPPCAAAMIRREGLCGKPAAGSLVFIDRDPVTGAGRTVGFCSRHGALGRDINSRLKQWRANGSPQPADNAGGVLPRYFDGDWPGLYRWAKPWQPLGTGPGKPPAPPRPTLTLIQGGA